MKFNEKLYTLRKTANMTQTELAERLNVSRQAVSRWEMGTAKPEVDTLIAISDLFQVSLDELLKNKEETPQLDIPEPPVSGPRFWDFLHPKWWVAGVMAVAFRLIPYLIMLVLFLISYSGINSSNTVADATIGTFALIPLFTVLSSVSFIALAGFFVAALVKWLKARK